MGMMARKSHLVILRFLVLALGACGPVYQATRPTTGDLNKVRKLAVVIPSEESFTVVYDRAKATATPVMLFDLLGAGVAAAYNQSLDNDKVKALAPHLTAFSCRLSFLESLQKTLTESRRFEEIKVFDKEVPPGEQKKYDAIVTLDIQSWGLRLTAASETDELAGFIEMQTRMVQTQSNRTLWEEHDTLLGHARRAFAAYEHDGELLRSDLRETAESGGSRVANKLLYP